MSRKISRNDNCWCGSDLKHKKCHAIIEDKMAGLKIKGDEVPDIKLLKTRMHIEGICASSKINIAVLDYIGEYVVEGIKNICPKPRGYKIKVFLKK